MGVEFKDFFFEMWIRYSVGILMKIGALDQKATKQKRKGRREEKRGGRGRREKTGEGEREERKRRIVNITFLLTITKYYDNIT
ncbi:hypothetical protein GSQ39_14640 [Clostridioides difficile]|nr:hypothetical protein [Clostridioides difficile]